MRQPQFLCEQLEPMWLARCGFQMTARSFEGAQVPLARQEYGLAGRTPTRHFQYRLAQLVNAVAVLGRNGYRAPPHCRRLEAGREVDLVVNVDASNTGRHRLKIGGRLARLEYH